MICWFKQEECSHLMPAASLVTPPARRAWRSYKFAPFLFLLRLPVGRGGVINSPRFCFFFPVSKVGAPLMGDTAVHSLSHDFKLNF